MYYKIYLNPKKARGRPPNLRGLKLPLGTNKLQKTRTQMWWCAKRNLIISTSVLIKSNNYALEHNWAFHRPKCNDINNTFFGGNLSKNKLVVK